MVRRVVSVVRSPPAAMRGADPVLEVNAFAVAEAVDLAVLLVGPAVELALAVTTGPQVLGGVELPPTAHDQDLRGLVESGVAVVVAAGDLRARGIDPTTLQRGIRSVEPDEVAELLRVADAVLAW